MTPEIGKSIMPEVFVLGGAQTDFAHNQHRAGGGLFELFSETLFAGLASAQLAPEDVEAAHVGNFAAELFCDQGHLGGFFAAADPGFEGIPAQRHEAACASGSMAILSAMADIEAGRHELVAVLGVELMRNMPAEQAGRLIGAPAMWAGRERVGERYPWPAIFASLADEYDARYGLDHRHLAEIAQVNFTNARRNPLAQTRDWTFSDRSFLEDDEANPRVCGRLRRHDCGQTTDGGAIVFLASRRKAAEWAEWRGADVTGVARIEGWGHRTSHISYEPKVLASQGSDFVFPQVRGCILDAYRRAGISGPADLDGIETHDCFTITEYMAIDHFGVTAPGEAWKAVEAGAIAATGTLPVNPSGGLMGVGHPVGATGVRMLLDCTRQVTSLAGDTQVAGARRFAMLNIGGSATTAASFVVGAGGAPR
jgi:acetyl-CoA C-acetyltransferase